MRYPMGPMPPTTAVWPWPRTEWRRDHRDLHSFPTRRSSHLVLPQGLVASTAGAEPVRFVTTAEGRIAAGENYAFDDVKTQAEAALRALFGELAVGQPLYIARIIGTVMAVPGVENCRLTAPAADQPGAERSLITLGELTVTKGAEA